MLRLAVVSCLVGLALAACADPVPDCEGRFRLDESLTPAARAGVELAAAKWNELAGRPVATFDPAAVCVVRIEEHENLGTWRPTEGALVLSPVRMHDNAPGCANHMGDCLEAVALHEFGHAIGLSHVSGGHSVMSADGELVEEFSAEDRAECSHRGVCVR